MQRGIRRSCGLVCPLGGERPENPRLPPPTPRGSAPTTTTAPPRNRAATTARAKKSKGLAGKIASLCGEEITTVAASASGRVEAPTGPKASHRVMCRRRKKNSALSLSFSHIRRWRKWQPKQEQGEPRTKQGGTGVSAKSAGGPPFRQRRGLCVFGLRRGAVREPRRGNNGQPQAKKHGRAAGRKRAGAKRLRARSGNGGAAAAGHTRHRLPEPLER